MKRILLLLLCLLMMTAFAGCTSPVSPEKTNEQAESLGINPDETDMADDPSQSEVLEEEKSVQVAKSGGNDGIDVDLTVLSSVMVYSEIYNMMISPDDYIGKTVKMNGSFAYYKDESTGQEYFACIIQDATACCAQGMEFALAGDYSYPDDYPAVGDEITVTGKFETYDKGQMKYCVLTDAVME